MKQRASLGRFSSMEREVAQVLRRHGVPVDRGALGGLVAVHAHLVALRLVDQYQAQLSESQKVDLYCMLVPLASVGAMERQARAWPRRLRRQVPAGERRKGR